MLYGLDDVKKIVNLANKNIAAENIYSHLNKLLKSFIVMINTLIISLIN